MRKFARRVLIILLCAILGGLAGIVYTFVHDPALYTSESQLYVVPGDSEDMLRSSDGGLKQDFAIVFKSSVVMDTVKAALGTKEEIENNLEITTPANSNIIVLKYSAKTAEDAKKTVDEIARTAVRTTTIVPVTSISILQEGTLPEKAQRLNMRPNAIRGTVLGAAVSFIVCILAALFSNAFRPKKEDEEKDMLYANVLPRLKKLEQNSSGQILLPGATKEAVAAAAAKIAPDDELVQYMKQHRRLHRSTGTDALSGDDLEDDLLDFDDEDDEIERAAKAAEKAENEALVHHALQRHMAKAVAAANAAAVPAEDDILADDALTEKEQPKAQTSPLPKTNAEAAVAQAEKAAETKEKQPEEAEKQKVTAGKDHKDTAGTAAAADKTAAKKAAVEEKVAEEKAAEEKAVQEQAAEEAAKIKTAGKADDAADDKAPSQTSVQPAESRQQETAAENVQEKTETAAPDAAGTKTVEETPKRRSGTEILGRIRK